MKTLLAAMVLWTPPAIASDQYEATPTFTPDGREMYFMLSDPRFERYRLMASRCVDGAWSRPTPAPFAAANVQEGDPGITPDGQRLYFISMRHDPQGEDFDIWYVEHCSLALDLRILAWTVRMVVRGEGLYKGETGGWGR